MSDRFVIDTTRFPIQFGTLDDLVASGSFEDLLNQPASYLDFDDLGPVSADVTRPDDSNTGGSSLFNLDYSPDDIIQPRRTTESSEVNMPYTGNQGLIPLTLADRQEKKMANPTYRSGQAFADPSAGYQAQANRIIAEVQAGRMAPTEGDRQLAELQNQEFGASSFDIGEFENLLGRLEGSKMRQQRQKSVEGRRDIMQQGLASMMSNF
tara:strand:+ start:5189 stop:5815 length:627 start_codon:yes stop_codon:yes gene_type:complete